MVHLIFKEKFNKTKGTLVHEQKQLILLSQNMNTLGAKNKDSIKGWAQPCGMDLPRWNL